MLSVKLCGVELRNPTILASGILGVTKESVEKIGRNGAGAVTLKSLCHEERAGNSNPTMFNYDNVFLNAVGLPGQGIDNAVKEFEALDDLSIPIIGSVYGYKIPQFGSVTKKMAALRPAMIEVDISCPHMDYGKPYYADSELTKKVTREVKKNSGKIPVSIKLSPNVHDVAEIARAAEKGGADALTAINTATGMKIDLETKKPVLHNKIGGVSGPALKPIAVRCVYEAYEATKLPIIGTGGVTYGEDAIEMIMAGATAVGVGTAVYYRGMNIFQKICGEMRSWMKKHKIRNLKEMRGVAHK